MKTRRFCPKCGRPLLRSILTRLPNKYSYQCYGCDEDFYRVEVYGKKDLEKVRIIQKESIIRELSENNHYHSAYKSYPKHR